MATTRIKDLSESLALQSDMYIAADNEDGTRKVLAANLVDDTLTESGKFADAAAVGDALNEKVPKETGKGLSTEDFTTAEKAKLSGIEAGATNTLIDDTLTEEGQAADAKKTGNELNDLKDAISDFIQNNNIISANGTKIVNVPSGGLTNVIIDTDEVSYTLNGATTFIGELTCADSLITKLVYRIGEYAANDSLISATDVNPGEYYTFNNSTHHVVVRFKISTTNSDATDIVAFRWGAFVGEKRMINDKLYIDNSNVVGLGDVIDDAIDEAISELEHSDLPLEFKPFDNVNGVTNGTSYIQDNIVTQNGFQFCCFVNNDNKVIAGKKSINGNEWEFAQVTTFPADVKLDGHYTLSMGIDKEGAIHIAGGMHCGPMRYVRSASPYDISSFVRFAHMVGDSLDEQYVSYPQFVKKKDGDLLCFYRAGNNPYTYIVNAFIAEPNNHRWVRLSSGLISGDESNGYPYLNHIATDSSGRIHISGCWRSSENKNIFYMYNDDNGSASHWKRTDGTSYTLPVTQASCEIIQNISSVDNGLLNQNGMFCDDDNNPHIVYFKVDDNNHTNLFHLYLKNGVWTNEQITNYKYKVPTNLTSYEGQIARPSIFCYKGRVFVVYRHNYMDEAGKLLLLEVTNYPATKQCVLFDANLTAYDFTFDTNSIANGYLFALITNTTTAINESISESIRYDELLNWKNQLSGFIAIDLEQIDDVLHNKIRIPSLKTIASSNSKIVICYTALRKFVKATVHRTNASDSETHLYLTLSNGNRAEIGTICMYSTSPESIKSTPYIPINIAEDENVIFSYEDDNGNVDFVTLEYAVLDF